MNPLVLAKAAPWIAAVVLAALLALMTNLYLGKRDDLTTYKATVAQANADQLKALNEIAEQREKNLIETRKDYEAKVPIIRANAISAYCLRNPALCQPAARCKDGPSVPVDDGAVEKPVACEREFITNSAEDALKLGAWQDYCKRNNCPIED